MLSEIINNIKSRILLDKHIIGVRKRDYIVKIDKILNNPSKRTGSLIKAEREDYCKPKLKERTTMKIQNKLFKLIDYQRQKIH